MMSPCYAAGGRREAVIAAGRPAAAEQQGFQLQPCVATLAPTAGQLVVPAGQYAAGPHMCAASADASESSFTFRGGGAQAQAHAQQEVVAMAMAPRKRKRADQGGRARGRGELGVAASFFSGVMDKQFQGKLTGMLSDSNIRATCEAS